MSRAWTANPFESKGKNPFKSTGKKRALLVAVRDAIGPGKKRALLIGIQNVVQPDLPRLEFAHRDAKALRDYLISNVSQTQATSCV